MHREWIVKRLSLGLAIFLFGVLSASAQAETWFVKVSKIRIAESNRSAIEALMSNPIVDHVAEFERSRKIYYRAKNGMLAVEYSVRPCTLEGKAMPSDTALDFFFLAFKPLKIDKSKLELANFDRSQEEDTPNWVYIGVPKGARYTL